MITESPIVGTGIEYRAAKDSGILVLAEDDLFNFFTFFYNWLLVNTSSTVCSFKFT